MSWWQKQRIPLIALLAATLATTGVHVWLDVAPSSEGKGPAITSVDSEGDISGQTLSIRSVRWDEFDAPAGSRTLSVLLHASGGREATTCGEIALAEVHGTRVWLDSRSVLDVPSDAGERSCLEESLPYDILIAYIVPVDAVGPFHLDVSGSDDEVIRFTVEP